MISITKLENKRRGMSKPEDWLHDEATYRYFSIIGQDIDVYMDNSCDARGLVATIKAAPVLIEIAKALLDFEGIEQEIDAEPDLIPMSARSIELGSKSIEAWKRVDELLKVIRR